MALLLYCVPRAHNSPLRANVQNYMASREFVSRIESFCPTVQHLQHLRNHDAYTNFEKRWQLSVYFQLRLKEIVGRLEESLASRDAAGEP